MDIARLCVFLLTIAALTGCVTQQIQHANKAKTELVGFSQEKIISCAGIPHNTATLNNKEYWSYQGSSVYGDGGGIGTRSCKATLTFEGGVVSDIAYVAKGRLLSKHAECGALLGGCL